jgi:peptidoglycan/xylan/chitin deacetylase (PgdA/CDA1 family)
MNIAKQTIIKTLRLFNIIYKGQSTRNCVALTFDDGPHETNTLKILRILEQCSVKATFFIVGSFAAKYPELVKLIFQKGHEVANHSYSHEKKIYPWSEIAKTNAILHTITGISPKLYRPPWKKLKVQQILYLLIHRMITILWSVDIMDWKVKDSNELLKNLYNAKLFPGDIILLHENRATTVEALYKVIENVKERGFEFASVSDIIGINKSYEHE